jgi:osmoprotectant transport system substrate-binding protein
VECSRENGDARINEARTLRLSRLSSIDVGLVFSTDGRVNAFDFLLLEDDQRFFPSYLLTPIIRKTALDQYPGLADHLNALSAKLDNATIADLNGMSIFRSEMSRRLPSPF